MSTRTVEESPPNSFWARPPHVPLDVLHARSAGTTHTERMRPPDVGIHERNRYEVVSGCMSGLTVSAEAIGAPLRRVTCSADARSPSAVARVGDRDLREPSRFLPPPATEKREEIMRARWLVHTDDDRYELHPGGTVMLTALILLGPSRTPGADGKTQR